MNKDLIKKEEEKKEQPKKATLQDFLAQKVKKEESKNSTIDIYVTSMDKTITLKKPSDDRLYDYVNDAGSMQDIRVVMGANKQLIYDCCQELHDKELHDALGVKDPYDLMNELFDLTDVKEIMNKFNKFIGNKNIEEEIKN